MPKGKWARFLLALAGVLAGIGALLAGLFRLLGQRRGSFPGDLDRKREEEAARIRESIKRESDQQLADRFNRLAKKERKDR